MDRYYTAIEKSFIHLVKNYKISSSIDTLADVLLSHGFIDIDQRDVISSGNVPRIKMTKLLIILLKKDTCNYQHLYNVLVTEIAKTRKDVARHLKRSLDNTQDLVDVRVTRGRSQTFRISQMVNLLRMLLQNHDNLDIFSVVCEEFKREVEWGQVAEMMSNLQQQPLQAAAAEAPQIPQCTEIFQTACREGYTDIVELFLQIGNVDINTSNGQPPLILAIQNENISIVSLLVRHPQLNVNIESQNGATGLAIACKHGYTDIVQMLLRHPDILVNTMSIDGVTPLMMASEFGHVEVVQLLLDSNGIDVNIENGATALLMACQAGHANIVQSLMKNGAVVNKRVVHVVRQIGNQDIINLVLNMKTER